MDVLAPALSSAPRPKSHYRGRRIKAVTEPEEAGVRAQNETLLLLNLLAYEVLHAGRCVMERATGTGWSLRRLRERVLRVASRVVRQGRRLTFVIAQDAAADWLRLWGKLTALDWTPGRGSRGPLRSAHRRSATGRTMSGPSARHAPARRPRRRGTTRALTNERPIRSRPSTEVPVLTDPRREPPPILNSANFRPQGEYPNNPG